jgi:hypothetical protein
MTSSRRSFLKLFASAGAAAIVAPHIEVSEAESLEELDTVVEPQKSPKCTESHSFDPNFQSSWIGILDGPVMVKCGVRCIRIPAGFTVAEIRENLTTVFRLPESGVQTWRGVTLLKDDYIVMDGYIEFAALKTCTQYSRVKEKGNHVVV